MGNRSLIIMLLHGTSCKQSLARISAELELQDRPSVTKNMKLQAPPPGFPFHISGRGGTVPYLWGVGGWCMIKSRQTN